MEKTITITVTADCHEVNESLLEDLEADNWELNS